MNSLSFKPILSRLESKNIFWTLLNDFAQREWVMILQKTKTTVKTVCCIRTLFLHRTMCHSVWKSHPKWLTFTPKVKYLVVFKCLNFRAKNVEVVVIATADSNITFEFCGATIPLKIENACGAICIIICNLAKWDLFMIFKQCIYTLSF